MPLLVLRFFGVVVVVLSSLTKFQPCEEVSALPDWNKSFYASQRRAFFSLQLTQNLLFVFISDLCAW